MKLLEERLRTRFCWGLTVNIYPPDFELRKEILRKKIIAGNFEAEIPEDVIEYIASNMGSECKTTRGLYYKTCCLFNYYGRSEDRY